MGNRRLTHKDNTLYSHKEYLDSGQVSSGVTQRNRQITH